MVQLLWPAIGQLHGSPTHATAMPATLKFVARTLTTLPPWDVVSPKRITLRILNTSRACDRCELSATLLARQLYAQCAHQHPGAHLLPLVAAL
jgi:hypothetical protein